MNFRLLTALFLLLGFCSWSELLAQEGNDCNLPAPQNLQVQIVPPDIMNVWWDPVPGAVSYDLMVVDLSTNQILYNANEPGITHTIHGIIPTGDMVIAVAGICESDEPGDYGIISPVGVHIEDLVVQFSGPNGPQVTHGCLEIETAALEITWTTQGGTTRVSLPTTSAAFPFVAKTFVQIESSGDRSLVQLDRSSAGVPVSIQFPHRFVAPVFVNNTTSVRWRFGNGYDVNTATQKLYAVGLSLNHIDFTFPSNLQETMQVSTKQCLMGFPTASGEVGTLGLNSTATNTTTQRLAPEQKTRSVDLRLSPNPTSDRLYITGLPEGTDFRITDINGRLWSQTMTTGTSHEVVVANWPVGLYILHYINEQYTPISRRFIVH